MNRLKPLTLILVISFSLLVLCVPSGCAGCGGSGGGDSDTNDGPIVPTPGA